MKNYPKVALKVTSLMYAKLVTIANALILGLTGNSNFTLPIPTIANLQSATTDVENAIAKWGPKGARGSRADLLDLRQKSVTLHQLLKASAEYVQNTAELAAGNDYEFMASIIATSGLAQALQPAPVGLLEPVRDLRRMDDPSLNQNQFRSRWIRPENTKSTNDVHTYAVYKGTTPDFSASTQVTLTAKAEYSETNNSGVAVTWYYWIVPYSTAGAGAVSDVMMIRLLAA